MAKSQRLSISVVKGRGNLNHNNREFVTKNVDESRIKDNRIYVRQTIEEAYEVCFGKAVEEYDARQKRKDRRIGGANAYLEKIRHSGNNEKEFYEIVVQVGNMQDCAVGSESGEIAKQILDDYMRSFCERNPNLYVFNAVMHLDEKTPHLHIDYIPIAREYKQGLMARNSLDKALKEMGIEVEGKVNRHNNRNRRWQEREKDVIEEVMSRYDIQRAAEKGLHRKHMTVEQYKATVEQIHNEVKSIPKQINEAPVLFSRSKVIVEKDELEKLEQRSKLSMVHEKAVKELLTDSEAELRRIAELKERVEEEREQSRLQVANAYSKSEEILTSTGKRAETILEEARKAYISAEMEKEKYQQKYEEQMDLNARYEQLKEKQADSEKKIEKLRGNIGRLRKEKQELQMNLEEIRKSVDDRIKAVTEPLQKQIEGLKEALGQAYRCIASIVNAVNMLAYDRSLYKADLTPKQKNLIDAITDYASARTREHGFDDVAEKMETQLGISEGIQNYLPKDKKRDRNMSR